MATPTPATSAPRLPCETLRVPLGNRAATTIHVLRLPRALYTARVAVLRPLRPLAAWCAERGIRHALIGGFYVRAEAVPLGLLRAGGRDLPSRPFDPPWHEARACVHVADEEVSLRWPGELAPGAADLLQAGPMLARAGRSLIDGDPDPEGFSAGSAQFDSDITAGRYPRAALGLSPTELIAFASDGRARDEAGLTLAELADTMLQLGATDAINLDGGGSTSLVSEGRLVNTPREEHGIPIAGGRAVATALAFALR